MAITQTLEPTPKRVRAKRWDLKREMDDLATHCRVSIDLVEVLLARVKDDPERELEREYWAGQLAAVKNVLARIERKP